MEQNHNVNLNQNEAIQTSKSKKILGAAIFLSVFQGIVLFGPQLMGKWAHDHFHGCRHSIGMACH